MLNREDKQIFLDSIRNTERILYKDIESSNNTMNECDCEDRAVYDFKFTLFLEGELYHYQLFCINCGGFVELEDVVE